MSIKKLWQKTDNLDKLVEQFTVGQDRELDLHLAEFDVLGSLAHIQMLQTIDLLTPSELTELQQALISLYHQIKQGDFEIESGVEDVHSQVELILTRELGESGKKIHSGRSRNDQVLLDMRLFMRDYIQNLVSDMQQLFQLLLGLSEQYKDILLPGYTHMQVAMPSSFGLWFAAYAESLTDDLLQLQAAYKIINKNPLGSAAGYGSSFPLNRTLTTQLLGFEDLNYNVVYAQMGRGRSERVVSQALASLAETLGRMADDIILFMSQNFAFISFPETLTTGSSIMPHKKNPDIFEILRARCNQIKALPNEIMMLTTNLSSGYQRDMQIVKERFIPALFNMQQCLQILQHALPQIKINTSILEDERYTYLFTVDAVNQFVQQGLPFREAYLKVSRQVEEGTFTKPENLKHTHEGSIHNLSNDKIKHQMEAILKSFPFAKVEEAINQLLKFRK